MRAFLLALLLTTAVLTLPAASAAGFAEDAPGDTQTQVIGQPAPLPNPSAEAADLLALDVQEDAEEMTFILKVAKLDQPVSFSDYTIDFSWNKDEYRVVVQRSVAQGAFDESSNAYLIGREADEGWDAFANLDHEIDAAAGLITVRLPKAYILSDNGRFPLLGDELKDVVVEARSYSTIFQFTAESYDRMPDGEETLSYAFLFGDLAAGHIRLDADERVRVSNGGATTFVYQAIIQNRGELDDQVDLVLSEMPEGWNGTVQSPLKVPGGSERRIAVLVSVPFAHDHGGFSSFNLTVKSQRDAASMASIRMGVLHTPIPQPAGHHAELYLHAKNFNSGIFGEAFPFTQATMNTDSAHEGDAAEASGGGGGDGVSWYIPLDPGLRMGLDFDIEDVGTLAGAIIGHTAQSAGSMSAELLLVATGAEGEEDSDGILLAESDSVDMALDMSTPQPFQLTLTPTEDADYIPYVRGQNLLLVLRYSPDDGDIGSICCLPATTPALTTADFKLVLPLNEYHDKLNGLAETAQSLELKAEGAVEKAGLPGTTMTYTFTLVNQGSESEIIELDLAGTDALLGTLVPSGAVELGSKETRRLTLAVTIPSEKNVGEELEVLVFAHAQADPSKSAIARTKTIVSKAGAEELAADESGVLLAAQQAEEADTPAPGAVYAIAALGIALAAGRFHRRRQS